MKPLWKVKGFFNRTSWKVSDVQIVRYTWVLVAKDKSNHPWLIPFAVSLRRAGVEQLYQVKRMIGGIGNFLSSIFTQTENVQDPRVFFGEPLGSSDNFTWAAELAMTLCVFCVVCCALCVLLVCSVWVGVGVCVCVLV